MKYRKYFECSIGGQIRTLRFGTNTTALYCELRECEFFEFEQDFDTDKVRGGRTDPACLRDLVWAALKEGERWLISKGEFTGVVEKYSNQEVGVWLDELTDEERDDFSNKFIYIIAYTIIDKMAEDVKKEKKSLLGRIFSLKPSEQSG